jgi:hypothetical protein
MKKYIPTEKHPVYKTGVTISNKDSDSFDVRSELLESHEIWESVKERDINISLKNGWIKEIQQPLFTRDDMLKFVKDCGGMSKTSPFFLITKSGTIFNYESFLDTWDRDNKK